MPINKKSNSSLYRVMDTFRAAYLWEINEARTADEFVEIPKVEKIITITKIKATRKKYEINRLCKQYFNR